MTTSFLIYKIFHSQLTTIVLYAKSYEKYRWRRSRI